MPLDWIVRRASPDWERFDIEDSRAFLRRVGGRETLLIDFVSLWDRSFKGDYRTIRAQLKKISEATYRAVRGARTVSHEEWSETSSDPNAWIAFADDDDWMAPHLFETLGRAAAEHDGARWANLRLGRLFADDGYAQGIIQRRHRDSTVYTNNYAVTDRTIRRLGRAVLFEHKHANVLFQEPSFRLLISNAYLSCAVKHPCCTVSANFLMKRPDFLADPHAEITRFVEVMHASKPLPEDAWLTEPYARFCAFMTDALRPR